MKKGQPYLKLLILFLVLIGGYANSQIIRNYTLESGLPHNSVYRLHQQENGLIWLGTDEGLCSFDGSTFEIYTFGDTIQQNSVMGIEQYCGDTLLIYLYRKGFYFFHQGEISLYKKEIKDFYNVIRLLKDDKERIWILNTQNRLGVLEKGNFTPVKIHPPDRHGEYVRINAIEKSDRGDIYLATKYGLYRSDTNQTDPFTFQNIYDRPVHSLYRHLGGSLVLGTDSGIMELGTDDSIIIENQEIILKENDARLLKDADGKLWYTTTKNGLFSERMPDSALLGSDRITDILLDHENNIWAGTIGDGLFGVFPPYGIRFISNKETRVIVEDEEGNILLGGLGQILISDPKASFKPMRIELQPGNQVMSMSQVGPDKYIAGTSKGVYEIKKGQAEIIYPGEMGFSLINLEGNFLFGGYGLRHTPGKKSLIDSTIRVNDILKTSAEKLWIASNRGVFNAQRDKQKLTIGDSGKLNVGYSHDLWFDPTSDKLWAATDMGLFNKEAEGNWKKVKLGWENTVNSCRTLAQDRQGRIWLGTTKGLYYEKQAEKFEKILLPIPELFSEIYTLHIDRKNQLWIGTSKGVIIMALDKAYTPPVKPRLNITEVWLGNEKPEKFDELKIDYNQGNLVMTINSRAIAFSMADQIIYRHRLLGFDKDWYNTKESQIEFRSLPPGKYTFQLQAGFYDTEIFSELKEFSFEIVPPFYQTPVFISLVVLLISSGGYFFILVRLRAMKKKQLVHLNYINQINEHKYQALSAMINPHFVSNTLISIQNYIKNHNKARANEYVAGFARLIRMSLEMAPKNKILLAEEVERLELYLSMEKLRLGNKLNYFIYVDDVIDEEEITIPNMIVQPFLENAIWHGIAPKKEQGNIQLNFSLIEEDKLEIQIKDDGVGMREAMKEKPGPHRSLGITLIKERLSLLNERNSISLESGRGSKADGTIVRIILHLEES